MKQDLVPYFKNEGRECIPASIIPFGPECSPVPVDILDLFLNGESGYGDDMPMEEVELDGESIGVTCIEAAVGTRRSLYFRYEVFHSTRWLRLGEACL